MTYQVRWKHDSEDTEHFEEVEKADQVYSSPTINRVSTECIETRNKDQHPASVGGVVAFFICRQDSAKGGYMALEDNEGTPLYAHPLKLAQELGCKSSRDLS